jgi:hypothetical protein
MHTIFKNMNTDRIELPDGYHLEPDGYRGLTLVFEESRLKRNKKTGEEEPFTFVEKWYYPKISQVLNKYLIVTTNEAKSIEQLKEILERIESKIDELKDNF